MKQVSRGLILLLVLAVVIAAVSTSVFAANDPQEIYDGEGDVWLEWNRLNNVSRYDVSIYYQTVYGDDQLLASERFGPNDTKWKVTTYIKQNGPGMYPATFLATKTNGTTVPLQTDLRVIQIDKPAAPTVEIGESTATVSWTDPLPAPGGKVVATLTDPDDPDGEPVATHEYYPVEAGANSVDVTEFVKEYADSEKPLVLSATLTVLGDLTVRPVTDEGITYLTCYLNSEPSDPGVAVLDPTADPAEPQLVGQLPTAVITSTEVYADLPDQPGKLFVDYKFNDDGAVDNTYVKTLTLHLEGKKGNTTHIVDVVLNASEFEGGVIPATGTIAVSDIVPFDASYTWTISLDPKYVGNEAQADTTGTVVYNIYDLPAPELTVANDASTISWPAVVASDDVAADTQTTYDEADFYSVVIYKDGEVWQELTGGAIVKNTGEDGAVSFSVNISDKLAEGETKTFEVTLTNKKNGEVYDPRFTETSSDEVEVYKTIQPTNVAFDLVKYFPVVDGDTDYLNPPGDQVDKVYLKWTKPTSIDGIASYLITIYEEVTTPAAEEGGEPTVTKTPATKTVAASDVTYDNDGIAYVDVSDLIDPVNVAVYTATVQSIGKYLTPAADSDAVDHFDADSGVTPECAPETSGAVASGQQSASIVEQNGKLVLIVNLTDTNSNIDKVESVWLSNFNNGNTSYLKVIKGNLDKNAATVTFDLSEFYADPNNDQAVLPSGTWTGDVSVYSYNAGLNADTTVNVSATYNPEKLEIRGGELVDPETGEPTGEYGEPLVVDPETGVVSWLDAYAYDDETDEKIEDSKADYYNVKLEYYNGSSWKSIKLQGGNDEEWEKIDDTDAESNQYVINDPDAADGVGMVPGRVYRVVVQAFSNRPLEYAASDKESTYLCKFPAVVAELTDYAKGELSWTGSLPDFTYPDDTTYQIDAVDGETAYTGTDDASPYSLYELLADEDGNADYGTYDTTVTVLPIVVDGVSVGQESVTVNYIQSDPSAAVTAYRGVVPAEDIDGVEIVLEPGNKISLVFTLPTEDDYTDADEKAEAAAIDTDNVTVKLYTDNGTLLGEYASAYDAETGISTADITIANKVSSAPNLTDAIDPGEKLVAAICVGSTTEYIDGYADFEVLEGDKSPKTLADYLSEDVADDAVKVAKLQMPERPAIVLEPYIDTETGDLFIPADPTAEADADANLTYTVEVSFKNNSGNIETVNPPLTVTGPITDDSDPDNVKTYYTAATSTVIPAGADEVKVKVTVEDGNGKYAGATKTLNAYKLVNPTVTEVNKKTGILDYTADEFADTKGYAYTKAVTFATADVDPYTGAESTENTATGEIKIKFDLGVEAQDVTTILALIGGYDTANDIYVIDADNVAEATTLAGQLFHFTLVSSEIKVDADDNYYVELQADTTHPFWSSENDDNYLWWQGAPNDLKVTFKAENGATIPSKPVTKAVRNAALTSGVVKIYLYGIPTPETEYTLEVTTNPKTKYEAVAGGYTETLAVDDVPSTVVYGVKYLEVKDLEYNYVDGKATWTADEHATAYIIDLKRDDGEENWTAVQDPVTVTKAEYEYAYEAGKPYMLTVTATNPDDPNYKDSRPSVDNSIIYIYKLLPAEDVAVSDKTGELSYTDPAANAAYAHDKEVTVTPDSAEDNTIPAGAYNETDNKVEFTKVGTPDDVTTSVTLTGGYDSTSDYYVLDSEAKDTPNKVGELFHFSLANNGAIQKDSNGYYVELEAITPHDFWSEDNDLNYLWWQGAPNDLKGVLTGDSGTINTKPITKAQRDAALTSGKIKLYLKSAPADSEYTLALTTNPKAKYAAVAGGYTEELSPVTYGVQYLKVEDLAYDYEAGKATWTKDNNAEQYIVKLERDDGEENWTAVQDPVTVTNTEYEYAYEAGKPYKLTVTATTSDPNYEDSRPDEDNSIIYIYKLLPAEKVAVSDRDGALSYTDPAANNAYAHSYEASFDPSDKGSEADKVVEFVKTAQPPEEVTTSVTLTGGYDSASEYYVLDSEPADTKNLVGELFHFTLVDGSIQQDANGYYVELQADTAHDFWSSDNDTNYMWWQKSPGYAPNELTGVFSYDGGTMDCKPVKRAHVDFATGIVKIYFKNKPYEEETYTLTLTTNPKAKYAAVAGGYTETLKGTIQYASEEPVTPPDAPELSVDLETGEISWGGSSEAPVTPAPESRRALTSAGDDAAAGDATTYCIVISQDNDQIGEPIQQATTSYTPTFGGEEGLAIGEVYTVSVYAIQNGVESEPASVDICKQAAPEIDFEKDQNEDYTGNYIATNGQGELTAEVYLGNALEIGADPADVTAPSYVNEEIIAGDPATVTIHAAVFKGIKADSNNVYYIQSDKAEDLTSESKFKVGKLPALTAPTGLTTANIPKDQEDNGLVTFTFTYDPDLQIAKGVLALAEDETCESLAASDAEDPTKGTVDFDIPAETLAAITADATYTATLVPAYPAINTASSAEVTITYEEPDTRTPIDPVDPLYYGVFVARDGSFNTANNGGATLYFKEVDGAKLKKNGGYKVTIADSSTGSSYTFTNDQLNGRSQLPEACGTDDYFISVKRVAINTAASSEAIDYDPANWTVTITDYPVDDATYKENTAEFTTFTDGLIESIPVNTILNNAIAFVYPGGDETSNAYEYTGLYTVAGDSVTYSCSFLAAMTPKDEHIAAVDDMARLLGAVYRANEGVVSTITYNSVDYTWNTGSTLKGSKWTDASGNTLVSALATALGSEITGVGPYSVPLQIDGEDVTVKIALTN